MAQNGDTGKRPAPKDWHCDECGRWNRHYWVICPSCSGKRIT